MKTAILSLLTGRLGVRRGKQTRQPPMKAHLFALLACSLLLAACSLISPPAPSGAGPLGSGGGAPTVGLPVATYTAPPPAIRTATLPVNTPTQPPTLTPTPPAVVIRQLTSGGCCVGPFWSPDGSRVLFIDKPSPEAPSGLWGASLAGGAPELFTDRLGIFSSDMQLRAFPQNRGTIVERLSDGAQWAIPSQGRQVSFSPDGTMLAWTAGQNAGPLDQEMRTVWVSRSDGSEAREVITLYGGGFSGWFPDGRLLVSGKLDPNEETQAYMAVSLSGGAPTELARGERLRGGLISPQGTWLAYMVTFSENPEENGLWLVHTGSGEKRRLEVFGAYRWRDDSRLLVVPLDLTQPTHRLLEVEAASLEIKALTDPQLEPFKIANGDWSVSPDGRAIAFVSAEDGNIWLIELPG